MRQRATNLLALVLVLLGLLAVTSHAQGGSTNQPAREAIRLAKEKAATAEPATKEELADKESAGTTFNGQHVPPMFQLGKTYEEDIMKGYWLVDCR